MKGKQPPLCPACGTALVRSSEAFLSCPRGCPIPLVPVNPREFQLSRHQKEVRELWRKAEEAAKGARP